MPGVFRLKFTLFQTSEYVVTSIPGYRREELKIVLD